jgi:hypothetical protein
MRSITLEVEVWGHKRTLYLDQRDLWQFLLRERQYVAEHLQVT